jgi:protein arginine N-methyltransferase 3
MMKTMSSLICVRDCEVNNLVHIKFSWCDIFLSSIIPFSYQVAENRCWSCGVTCQSNQDLQNHLHETVNVEDIKPHWEDDRYLKPFMKDDSLLYSFGEDEEDYTASVDKEELMRDLENFEENAIDDENAGDTTVFSADTCDKNGGRIVSASNDYSPTASSLEKVMVNGVDSREHAGSAGRKLKDEHLRASFPTLIAKDIKNANKNYFGAYSSFGIHREMISDKVRSLSLGFW